MTAKYTTEFDPPIKAFLEIRRTSDGEVRKELEAWDFHGDFIWSEGNYACDCNRYLFFCRAAGESEAEDEDDPEHACGSDRYSIQLKDRNGAVLYADGWFEDQITMENHDALTEQTKRD